MKKRTTNPDLDMRAPDIIQNREKKWDGDPVATTWHEAQIFWWWDDEKERDADPYLQWEREIKESSIRVKIENGVH
jgi:hypothetical protein